MARTIESLEKRIEELRDKRVALKEEYAATGEVISRHEHQIAHIKRKAKMSVDDEPASE